jgi:hypothetical protein
MSTVLTAANGGPPPSPFLATQLQPISNEELDRLLSALQVPFDLNLVQWRIMEWSEDGKHALMTAYADPRAYSDRLNSLFTPAGWTHKYNVQVSAAVQRSKRAPAAKILVTCDLTIHCIGFNSGTGEEWLDREHALAAADAQAFKRACAYFGLGRYLYDIEGEWVELDDHGTPARTPKLSRWATPAGWLSGLRPKPRKDRRRIRPDLDGRNGSRPVPNGANTNGRNLVPEMQAMEPIIGKRMYRGVLKRLARAWAPEQIQDFGMQQRVLEQMKSAERMLMRLKAVEPRITAEAVQRIMLTFNIPPLVKIDDPQALESLVVALEKEAERSDAQT